MNKRRELKKYKMYVAGEILIELIKKEPFVTYSRISEISDKAIKITDSFIEKLNKLY